MPQFFFDRHDSERLILDEWGQLHEDRDAAREEALRVLPELARDSFLDGEGHSLALRVRDETGMVIFAATMCRAELMPEYGIADAGPEIRDTLAVLAMLAPALDADGRC